MCGYVAVLRCSTLLFLILEIVFSPVPVTEGSVDPTAIEAAAVAMLELVPFLMLCARREEAIYLLNER